METFGTKSSRLLQDVDPRLVDLCNEVLQILNITIITGYRDAVEQLAKYKAGLSKVKKGKHNEKPSLAVDVSPWPIPENWGDPGPDKLWNSDEVKELAKFYYMHGVFAGVASQKGIKIRGGHDWDGDNDFSDQTFDDLLHIEIDE